MRVAVGSNKTTYDGPVYTPTADLITTKLHLNSVLSTPYSKYLIIDVKNFYLKNPMKKNEYYKISIKLIPQDIVNKYELKNKQIYYYI